jgi:hypothetical protein
VRGINLTGAGAVTGLDQAKMVWLIDLPSPPLSPSSFKGEGEEVKFFSGNNFFVDGTYLALNCF